ncbi:hypothetical protein [Paenibacillus sp. JNUCC31]|uniref:hypothetical protein n=1 Tax=Paenibacillus sp. JNUCC-31 TaxID=2777983 RepID=UPI001E3BE4C3|nr:hypothetical protein [Paenibacillus sp. JNUCC-31]
MEYKTIIYILFPKYGKNKLYMVKYIISHLKGLIKIIKKLKFFPVALSFALLLVTFQPTAMAKADILNDPQLDVLSSKYDVEFVPYDSIKSKIQSNSVQSLDKSSSSEIPESLKFKDMEEYESFLAQLRSDIDSQNSDANTDVSVDVPDQAQASSDAVTMAAALADVEDSYTISWFAPFTAWGFGGATATKNISVQYSYKYVNNWPQYTGVSKIGSHLGGLNLISWEQTSASKTYSQKCAPKDKANFKVNGYFLLGAEVAGFPIGAKVNDTWEGSLTLKPSDRDCF